MFPALVAVIVASFVDTGDDLWAHAEYYRIVSLVLVIFSAIIAPELLCADRRNGVINLYLVRPLTTSDYLAGRWAAFFSVTIALTYFGQVVLLVGLTLVADKPLDYIRDNWLDIPRFLLAGIVVAVFTTTLPMAVSAFTTRRAYAAVFVIAFFLISIPVSGLLTATVCVHESNESRSSLGGPRCEPVTGDAGKWLALLNAPQIPMHVNDLIFDLDPEERTESLVSELPDIVPVSWYVLFTLSPAYLLWWCYRRIKV